MSRAKTASVAGGGAKKMTLRRFMRFIPIYLLMLPGLIYLFINNYMPLPGLMVAFKKYNAGLGIFKSPWVGFQNFTYLFTTDDAWVITRNTIGYNLAFIVVNTVMAITVAIILSELTGRIKKFYQSAILLPNLISSVIIGYLVFAFFSVENGFVNNSILKMFGKEAVSWYSEAKYWPFILIFVSAWKSVGYNCIVYLATLMGFDRSFYESAQIDGATKWQQIRFITLPLSKPIITTIAMFSGIAYWNDWNNGYIYLVKRTDLFSIQNLLNRLMQNIQALTTNASNIGNAGEGLAQIPSATVRMAMAAMGILPIIIVYPFIQKNFVKGITLGGVKG